MLVKFAPMGAKKDKERITARLLYVDQNKSIIEIANLVNVNRRTIGIWKNEFNWDALKNAKLNGQKAKINNIKEVIGELTNQRLELITQINELKEKKDKESKEQLSILRQEAVKIDDGISKWNKTLENMDKENRISLAIYLEIMTDIFKSLQNHDQKLFMNSLDFQEDHLQTITEKYA